MIFVNSPVIVLYTGIREVLDVILRAKGNKYISATVSKMMVKMEISYNKNAIMYLTNRGSTGAKKFKVLRRNIKFNRRKNSKCFPKQRAITIKSRAKRVENE